MQCAVCKFENEHIFEADWFWHMLWISLWRLNFSIYAEWSSLCPLRTSLPWKPCSKTCKKAKCPWRRLVRCFHGPCFLAVFLDPFGHRAYQAIGLQEWLPREAKSLEDADIIICSEPMWLCPFVRPRWQCIEWIFVCWLIQRCIETEWKNQIIRRMPFAGDDSFEAGTRRSSVMLGVLHMALLNELFGRKFKLTSLCVCTFVIAASRSLGLCWWHKGGELIVKGKDRLHCSGLHCLKVSTLSIVIQIHIERSQVQSPFWCDKKHFLFLDFFGSFRGRVGSPARDRQTFGASGPVSSLCWKNVVCCLRRHVALLLSRCGGLLLEYLVVSSLWVAGETEDG